MKIVFGVKDQDTEMSNLFYIFVVVTVGFSDHLKHMVLGKFKVSIVQLWLSYVQIYGLKLNIY